MAAKEVEVEFSRPFPIGDEEAVVRIAAEPEERAALARRFALLALDSLTAEVRLQPGGTGNVIRLRAQFRADVVQSCVVTLQPVASRIEESVELSFIRVESVPKVTAVAVAPEGEDPPEPLQGEEIDLGEVVAEQLGVRLEPYPRRPGATFVPVGFATGAEMGEEGKEGHPFAVLRKLKE
ncbi:MAG: DUF177 domain-containing protein [Alphaproteobacteria bacterium]